MAGITGLAVLPAGPVPPNPLELLSRASFAALLGKAQSEFDVVLIDTKGQRAIDVFYISHAGAKLSSEMQESLREKLEAAC